MLHIKLKKITLPLSLCAISALLFPALTQADTAIVLAASSSTGDIAASRASEQRAALAKKAEAQKAAKAKKAEAKKAAEDEEQKEKEAEK
ncbi:MAG: hypothetical protein ISR72_05560 [Methylobacter sp.]|nr:hypothetical protein [Methylobacter sp.]